MGTKAAHFITDSRSIHRLSARSVASLGKPGYYCDGGGLYLQVSPAGARSWVYRFRHEGRLHEMGLGGVRRVSLASARERTQQCRAQLGNGLDPMEERRRERAQLARTKTFDECTTAHIRANRAGWKNGKHVAEGETTPATYASPFIGTLSVRDIDTTHVVSVLEPIWEAKPETASRVRGRVEAVLDWAKAHRYREHENEIIGARRGEFDLGTGRWTVPAERMKAQRAHRIPLSIAALALVRRLLDDTDSDLLFPGGKKDRPLSNMAMLTVLRRMKCTGTDSAWLPFVSRVPATAPLGRRPANWGSAARGAYDPVDAARITKAWETLHSRHRDMLRTVYLWRANREVICRRLHMPRRPAQRFELELAAARAALENALDRGKNGPPRLPAE